MRRRALQWGRGAAVLDAGVAARGVTTLQKE